MKQTTIQLYVEEAIFGATLFATSNRTKFHPYNGSRTMPLPEEEEAWRLIAGDSARWGIGRAIEPKEGEFDNLTWFKNLSERIERVCGKRKFKTKVRSMHKVPQGYATRWAVTFFWNKPVPQPVKDTYGTWTLREWNGTFRRPKIITKFNATLECSGDDLYCYLPDGCIPDGYEVYPDYESVIVQQSIEEEIENSTWWEFRFKATRKKGETK